MSRVYLIAADKPLPLCHRQAERTRTVTVQGSRFTVTAESGFSIREHTYYRHAVDILDYPLKPYQYELALELHEDDLRHLLEYLTENFSTGETLELWSVWAGIGNDGRLPPHYACKPADFGMDTLEQFLNPKNTSRNAPGQCRITVTI